MYVYTHTHTHTYVYVYICIYIYIYIMRRTQAYKSNEPAKPGDSPQGPPCNFGGVGIHTHTQIFFIPTRRP